jgi:hypothetical protein
MASTINGLESPRHTGVEQWLILQRLAPVPNGQP